MAKINWINVGALDSRVFKCSYCGNKVASEKGWYDGQRSCSIYICPECSKPTYFTENEQIPGISYGNTVNDILDERTRSLYEEARKCCSINSYTAAVLSCRKLLMHIAVSEGADKGLSFKKYVDYLKDNHYLPPNSDWVDHIRQKGNEANHEIIIMKKEDAEELIEFTEMLLKIIYEYPSRMKNKISSSS